MLLPPIFSRFAAARRPPRGAGAAVIDYVARWGVVEHWALDAASGNETGLVNSQVLVATNAPTSAAGKVGTSRQFNSASSRRFTLADNATMSTGDIHLLVSAWGYLDSKPAAQMFVACKGAPATGEWGLLWDNTLDRFQFYIKAGGGTQRTVTANTFGAPSTATFYHLAAYHNPTTDEIGIAVNGGAYDTGATSGTAPADSTGPFNVGALANATAYWDGRIDEVTVAKPTNAATYATEFRDRLYNGGSGRAYPFLA